MSAEESTREWTQVVREQRAWPPTRSCSQAEANVTDENAEVKPNPTPTLNIQAIRDFHQTIHAEWRASDCRRLLHDSITKT